MIEFIYYIIRNIFIISRSSSFSIHSKVGSSLSKNTSWSSAGRVDLSMEVLEIGMILNTSSNSLKFRSEVSITWTWVDLDIFCGFISSIGSNASTIVQSIC